MLMNPFGASVKHFKVTNDLSTVEMLEQRIDETVSNYANYIP